MTTLALTPRDLAGPSLGRLAQVELRKASDTRAGRWLLGVALLASVVVAGVRSFVGSEADHQLGDVIPLATLPLLALLPVIGILLVTSEWSQRTALATFALVPDRRRVLAAKAVAALALALTGYTIAVTASVIAVAASGAPDAWDLSVGQLGQGVLCGALNMLWGLGFGLLLRTPPAAIVAYFGLPTLVTLLSELIGGLEGTWPWIDLNRPITTLSELDASGTDWWQLLTASGIWIAAPLVVGTVLLLRREVK